MKKLFASFIVLVLFCTVSMQSFAQDALDVSQANVNYLHDYLPLNSDGTVNAVIEIPSGTNEKWEVKKDGRLRHDLKNGKPRIVAYLGYPCNYGMVPQTLLSKDRGGDGDPLDILVLGSSLARGTVTAVKVIGVFKMMDGQDMDDKLLAVLPNTALASVSSIAELEEKFPGAINILQIWFANYKGPNIVVPNGVGTLHEAGKLLENAMADYRREKKI